MDRILSNQNSHVKAWSKLATKKGRQENRTYLLDGWHLVEEAVKAGAKFHAVMATEEQMAEHLPDVPHGVPAFEISAEVAKHIAGTNTPQGIFAEISLPDKTFNPSYVHDGAWLLLDNIQDPGNVGTLIRTADAAGFKGVVLGAGTADVFAPKVVRAMQGSQFHLEVLNGDLNEWVDALTANNLPVYGSQLNESAKSYRDVEASTQFGLIVGNEGQGMSDVLAEKTTANLYIPLQGQAESLNVAIAGGILMFSLVSGN
ncbi:RNA methyltransferase [Leuconostoc carnosum]|uniref:rRNA methylase n=2 Tax=Leuconostoc carnosum TaxID=1252 RepID=K0D851_LEUCJ|nr:MULTISPECIES: RNA methyltransferase [Leuconostoc]AFT82109.1 rRNA methylase [Leuconostoc carnosum JB16]KAA8324712.1 RNA methyltransferase [Leuconostoc carnosum]KAA8327643.1 RNA methyltransferase [Leuconostoc carnosum]KAA8358650.1 RNA methyltransferase [Leuconostoc carnosum]KAA8364820.1 RNA methyltransferase [Leuconostoc carnosum]